MLELKDLFDLFIESNSVLSNSQQFMGRIQKIRRNIDVLDEI